MFVSSVRFSLLPHQQDDKSHAVAVHPLLGQDISEQEGANVSSGAHEIQIKQQDERHERKDAGCLSDVLVVTLDHVKHETWSAKYNGSEVARGRAAEYEACRALKDMGLSGIVEFWHTGSDFPSMRMDVEYGSRHTITETPISGPRVVKWEPFKDIPFKRSGN